MLDTPARVVGWSTSLSDGPPRADRRRPRGVTYLDSSGLAVLVRHYRRLGATPEALRVRDPNRPPRKVFEVTALDFLIDADPPS